jgi:hypothetical protein
LRVVQVLGQPDSFNKVRRQVQASRFQNFRFLIYQVFNLSGIYQVY